MGGGLGDFGRDGVDNWFLRKEISGERFRMEGGYAGGRDWRGRGARGWHFLWMIYHWIRVPTGER